MTIGINDRGEVVGVRNPAKLLEKLPVKFRDKLGLIDASISVVEIDGKECVRIVVPKAPTMVDLDGAFYIRTGSTTHKVSGERLKGLILSERNLSRMDLPTDLRPEDVSVDAIRYFVDLGREDT